MNASWAAAIFESKLTSVRDKNASPDRIVCVRLGGETAGGSDQPNNGPEVGRAAGCIPFLGGGSESPPGTAFVVGWSILVQGFRI